MLLVARSIVWYCLFKSFLYDIIDFFAGIDVSESERFFTLVFYNFWMLFGFSPTERPSPTLELLLLITTMNLVLFRFNEIIARVTVTPLQIEASPELCKGLPYISLK